jgi:sucrose phosphorylase
VKNQAQLIAYVDRLPGGTFGDLRRLLEGPLAGLFGGVHVLPFFHPIDGADAGFDPIDHTQVDARLGSWDDVAALSATTDVMADVIVNHISIRSPRIRDGLLLTYARVFPDGARESDLLALYTLRPGLPFTRHETAGGPALLWTTFTSEQIDIDVSHPEGRRYLDDILAALQRAGVKAIRLDAIGFAVKRAGTSCFMIPETYEFIADVTARAHAAGMEVLVELHGPFENQVAVAGLADRIYDFALPPLVLHTLATRDSSALQHWLGIRPPNAVTVLDTHDGISVGDAAGLLPQAALDAIADAIHARSGGQSRLASGGAAENVDSSQINCTFFDALGRCEAEYLTARAIQVFVPGVPQIYYVGLLAGGNDMDLLRRTRVGRDVNRHSYTAAELEAQLETPVVRSLAALLRLRNTHAAFDGAFHLHASPPDTLVLEWRRGADWARLDVTLSPASCIVSGSGAPGGTTLWRSGD